MSQFCQIEYVSSDSDVGMPDGKLAVAIYRSRSRYRYGNPSNHLRAKSV